MLRAFFQRDTQQAELAELLGTFFLTLAALRGGSPYAVALTLAAFVYALGPISGCNINPGVTVGLMAGRRLPVGQGLRYLVAQGAGALLARWVALQLGGPLPPVPVLSPWVEGGAFGVLMLTVVAVSDKYVPHAGSGFAIGAALAAGLLTSHGLLNPAVALALGQTLSAPTWAPLVGGALFTLLYLLIAPQSSPQGRPTAASDAA